MITGEAQVNWETKEKEKPQIEAVIFDLDGLLIDTEPLWSEGRKIVLVKYGVEYSPNLKKRTMGGDYRTGLAMIIDRCNLPLTVEEFARAEKKILDDLYTKKLKFMPGAMEFVKKIDEANILRAIATSSSRRRLNLVKSILNLYGFDAEVTGDEVENGKPAPDIFLKAAEKLGVRLPNCVVLEDAPLGIQAAKAANMRTVAVIDERFTNENDFAGDYKPDLIVDSLSKLDLQKLQDVK